MLAQALTEWPQQIDLKLTHQSHNGDRYIVEGLGHLADSIGDAYIGHCDEVFYRNLHWAINIVIHETAKYITIIHLKDLRQEAIKKVFDRYLSKILENHNDWTDIDLTAIKKYLEVETGYCSVS